MQSLELGKAVCHEWNFSLFYFLKKESSLVSLKAYNCFLMEISPFFPGISEWKIDRCSPTRRAAVDSVGFPWI
jgi:hypothetical protein